MSGALNQVGNIVRGVGTLANGVGTLASDLGFGGFGFGGGYGAIAPGLGPWAAGMQPASWRGLGFAARNSGIRRGRRVAVHEYPYRDEVWVEDLGRGTRTIGFHGFIAGDNVFQQRDAFLAAAESIGPAELVHPSLGSVTCVLVEFSAGERLDLGRVVELEFTFIQSSVGAPATVVQALSSPVPGNGGFLSDFAATVKSGVAAVAPVVATVGGYVSYAQRVVGDASLVVHAVTGLAGNFGRYSSGKRSSLQGANATVGSALAAVTTARTTVASLGATANSLAALL